MRVPALRIRKLHGHGACARLLALGLIVGAAMAQEEPRERPPEGTGTHEAQLAAQQPPMEEVIVKSRAWRVPRSERQDWRTVEPVIDQPRVRMRLGYDAEQELSLRRDNPLLDLDTRTVKPATIIRFRF